MGDIFVLVEHRAGEIREITYQMLWKADALCREHSHKITAILIGGRNQDFVDEISERADRLIIVEHETLKDFNGHLYKEILNIVMAEHRPFITLLGHTPWGMDLAPALSVKTGFPLATDCVDIKVEDGLPMVIRQIYNGKLFSRVSLKASDCYLMSVRPGAFPADRVGERRAERVFLELPVGLTEPRKRFLKFEDTAAGEVDISQADLLVSIGRGIGEEEKIAAVKELANLMGGVISCSRPVVDKNWLPKYHQVGTSGKSVKPRVYLALGISGAFQHVAGISGAGVVIAVNKDRKAPIFRAADYGVVDDLFRIVEALKEKLM
jgi:electron transfer flavoprotein alpha subunit